MLQKRILRSLILGLTCLLMLMAIWGWLSGLSPTAQAAPLTTYYVDGSGGDDSNNCLSPAAACATIAEAVARADDGETIEIADSTYHEYDISISRAIVLNGAGPETTIVDAGKNGRHFNIYAGATLANMTLRNGQTPEDPNIFVSGGGSLSVSSSDRVRLQNLVIEDNRAAGSGGAIFNTGNLLLGRTTLRNNHAEEVGGGIYQYGPDENSAITLSQSLIENNSATGIYGGGIYAIRNLVVQDSVIRGNSSTNAGGGIYISSWGNDAASGILERSTIVGNEAAIGAGMSLEMNIQVTMTNVTVSGNVADQNYAGIYVTHSSSQLLMVNSTVAGNTRTGSTGLEFAGLTSAGPVTLVNTLFSNDGQDCRSFGEDFVSLGHNLDTDNSCYLTEATDLPNSDPLLMPLGDYGGHTPTHALRPGSPAIDAANNAYCPDTDQRGVSRPYDGDNDGTATCDIGAVEAERQLTIAGASVVEGNSGTSSATFTVTLAPASDQSVIVDYTTQNGTATAPDDYTTTTGTLTFTPGQTTRTISVPIVADTQNEPDESFLVNLTDAANAVILIGTATGTIINDDGLPALSIGDAALPEGNSGTVDMTFAVTLSLATDKVVTVNYASADGTATAPQDYTAVSGVLTFQPGETAKQITVPIVGDQTDEGDGEAFQITLSGPANAILAGGSATGAIADDDTARLNLQLGPEVREGDSGNIPAVFTATLTLPASFVVTTDYEVISGFGENGATAGVDFTGQLAGTLIFQPGQTTKTFSVNVIGDTIAEADEQFHAELSNANVPLATTTAFAAILDDDELPNLSINSVSVSEGDNGTTDALFTVDLSQPSGQTVTVDYTTEDGAATAPADYTAAGGTLSFAPSETSKQITITVQGDTIDEGESEAFQVVLSNPDGANLSTATGTGTIDDDDTATLSLAAGPEVLEGESGVTAAVFTVTLSTTAAAAISVAYEVRSGSGTDGATAGVDFTGDLTGTLTFAPGETRKNFSVEVQGDTEIEPDEIFTAHLSNANAPIAVGEAEAVIVNDDSEIPILRIGDVTVTEGNSGTTQAVFNVLLINPNGQTVSVQYATQDGSATAPEDYTAASGNLVFTGAETGKQITVQVQGDLIDEATSEQFQVILTNPSNATISKATGAGTIQDDDTAQITLQQGPVVTEGDSGARPAVFTVTLSTPAAFTVTVDYEVRSGEGASGAFVGEDFSGVLTGTLAFAPGETTQSFAVNIHGDTKLEPDEILTAHLSNANVPIAVSETEAAILNDDTGSDGEHRILMPLIQR